MVDELEQNEQVKFELCREIVAGFKAAVRLRSGLSYLMLVRRSPISGVESLGEHIVGH